MTPSDLRAYMASRRLSIRGAAAELGVSFNRLQRMLAGEAPIPRYIGLAVAAIMWGLPPWPGDTGFRSQA